MILRSESVSFPFVVVLVDMEEGIVFLELLVFESDVDAAFTGLAKRSNILLYFS